MKLLVFEYSSVCADDSLISEGLCMLKGLLADLEKINYVKTDYLINEELDFFDFKRCESVHIRENLEKWLMENIRKYDYCIFIAPEDNKIQYNISKIIEENNVKILGSDSSASLICSSKFLTYQRTPSDIKIIKTFKYDLKNVDFDEIRDNFNDFEFVVKPDDKTSSKLVYHVFNEENFKKILLKYESELVNNFLIQEYIPGISVSVSLLCKDKQVQCFSVNSQEIIIKDNHFEYIGCVTPVSNRFEKKLFTLSNKIIRSIPGLNGFCGIDYIIFEDKIYFVEINSRITTPFIVLQKKCKGNLTEKMLKLMINDTMEEINFKEKGIFYKEE